MNNWQKVELCDIISFANGKKRPAGNGSIPVYGGNGILAYTNVSNAADCIIIGRVGAYCGSVFYENKNCWVSDNAIMAKAKEQVNNLFCYYLLRYLQLNKRHIGTSQPLLTQEILNKITVSVPSLNGQEKIAQVLSSLDDKIELNAQINHNLEEQAKAIFKSWFVDFEPFGGVAPDNWQKGKLKNILSLQKRPIKAGISKDLPYLPIDSIPMRTFAITDVRPNSEAQSSLLLFDKDDILIGAMRVYFHRVIIAPFDGITRTTCFVLKPNDPAYLSFALLTCDLDSSVDFAQKTSKGSTMPYAVWDGGMGEIDILIPPLNITMEFNSIVLPMLRKIQDSYREVYSLQKLRDVLLPKLMSGEIDVSEVEV